jgi:CubicO group peptidase (beta-lactamase class C family)
MILRERGSLSYEDDIKKYFPNLPYEGVSIKHLLNHTSGIPDYNEYTLDPQKYFGAKRVLHNADILDIMVKLHPAAPFKPSEKFQYSNTNYVILASVVRKVSGMDFNQFMTQNIFQPLGMTRTRMFTTQREKGEKLPNRADGYVYSKSNEKPIIADEDPESGKYVYAMDGIEGDGGLNSTTSDLFRWWKGLQTNKLVKKATMEEAYQPCILTSGAKSVSGFGWFIETKAAVGKIMYHSGGHPGYGAYIVQFPELNGVFIVLSNNSGRGAKGLIDGVIKSYGAAAGKN